MWIIFWFVSFWGIALNFAGMPLDVDLNDKRFCQRLAEVKPNTPFSFNDVLHIQGFTFASWTLMGMVAHNYTYKLFPKKLNETPFKMFLSKKIPVDEWHRAVPLAKVFELDPDDDFDMAYNFDVHTYFWRSSHVIVAFSEKRVMAIDGFKNQWGQYKGGGAPWMYHSAPVKLITDYVKLHDMKAYAIGAVPIKGERGLIIYSFELTMGTFLDYDCTWKIINNTKDLETERYFYLQKSSNTNHLRLVHPKTGNITAAKLFPLAERVMPGYALNKTMYLFDVDLGCVYIMPDWDRLDLDEEFTKEIDIVMIRRNVPFEKFFDCEGVPMQKIFWFLNPKRCDTLDSQNTFVGRDVGQTIEDQNNSKTQFWTGRNSETSGKLFTNVLKFSLLTIAIGVVAYALIQRKNMKKKNSETKNGKNRSSTEDGRAKKVSSKKQRSQPSSTGGGVSSKNLSSKNSTSSIARDVVSRGKSRT